jgi:uncharacterized membrane protein YwaF
MRESKSLRHHFGSDATICFGIQVMLIRLLVLVFSATKQHIDFEIEQQQFQNDRIAKNSKPKWFHT